jgi:hypothetical protein
MRDPVTTITVDRTELQLTKRELLALDFIGRAIDRRKVAPSMKEIMEHLNTKGYALLSFNQIWRIANSLRDKKLLEVPPYDETAENHRTGTTHRNMIPTKLGWKVIYRNKKETEEGG